MLACLQDTASQDGHGISACDPLPLRVAWTQQAHTVSLTLCRVYPCVCVWRVESLHVFIVLESTNKEPPLIHPPHTHGEGYTEGYTAGVATPTGEMNL